MTRFRLIIFSLIFLVAAENASSQIINTLKIDLDLTDKTLKEVISEIQQKSSIYFIYNERLIAPYDHISVSVKNKTAPYILNQILSNTSLHFIEQKNKIIIVEKNQPAAPEPKKAPIRGFITNENNEPLQGVSVYIPNTISGTQTLKDGEFVLHDPPTGDFSMVASHIGYDTRIFTIKTLSDNQFRIKLTTRVDELEMVVVSRKSRKSSWKRWGKVFTDNFIGTSDYAAACKIINPNSVRFILKDHVLYAFADEPLIIENRSLGYRIEINLKDFTFNFLNENGKGGVAYTVYSLFKELEGSKKEKERWKRRRQEVYYGSLLHFMRALYNRNHEQEGFEIRDMVVNEPNKEVDRIKEIYRSWYEATGDQLSRNGLDVKSVEQAFINSIPPDSINHYNNILSNASSANIMALPRSLSFEEIASVKDSATISLAFKSHLLITYTRQTEPQDYINYKNTLKSVDLWPNFYQNSIIHLSQGIPIEISASGYYKNIDLYLDGYWGWRERIATKLPYDYRP